MTSCFNIQSTTSKIFEKTIYSNLLNYIELENLLNINQSGFRASDSCINQLISITQWINRAFNTSPLLKVKDNFWIYPKPLTRLGTRDFCSNLNLLESVENCSIFSKTIFLIGFKGYYWMPVNLADFLLRLEFHGNSF